MAHHSTIPGLPEPPGVWSPARRLARRALAPVERFLAIEASSGILLLLAAAIALFAANSDLRVHYEGLWHTPIGLRLGPWAFERDLHFWINDGLMTIFFFVVGLEIRREIDRGELSELRRAMLPLAAALGGMLVPALIYLAFNHDRPTRGGWGVPMATDIAFAVGVLALLGKRVPAALRILLLALAVIDDLGAILVIAFFYSSGISLVGVGVAALGVAVTLALRAFGVRSPWAYVPGAIVAWAGAYASGVHPTLAGVAFGLLTPVTAWYGTEKFLETAASSVEQIRARADDEERALLPHLDAIDDARREAVSPVERLQHALHGWVAYGIMPLFALANAGVPLGSATFDGDGLFVFLGVGLGLVVGKPLGVTLLSYLSTRTGAAALPVGVRIPKVGLVGAVAGIGFTMALFIAQLAFPPGAMLETAKLAILVGSGVSALLAFALGPLLLGRAAEPEGAGSPAEAEASTHH
ncbi:Na+/H+ antiporter NhaA [Myxococcota bacterium]|nr:Na+/H+ antiporter NhaA [Myxococcota bacterium]